MESRVQNLPIKGKEEEKLTVQFDAIYSRKEEKEKAGQREEMSYHRYKALHSRSCMEGYLAKKVWDTFTAI